MLDNVQQLAIYLPGEAAPLLHIFCVCWHRYMYWTDWDPARPRIERAKLADGSQRQVIVSSGLRQPNGLVIDYIDLRVYWVDAGLNQVMSTKLDGSDLKTNWRLVNQQPYALVRTNLTTGRLHNAVVSSSVLVPV